MKNALQERLAQLKLFFGKLSFKRSLFFSLGFLGLLAVTSIWQGMTDKFDFIFFDLAQKNLAPHLTPSPELAVVAIDTETLEGVEQRWPWSRNIFADLIAAIDQCNPKAILIDIVFQHPDDDRMPGGDQLLARTIKKSGKVALIGFVEEIITDSGKMRRQFRSLKMFRDGALCEGFIHSLIDADGKIRTFSIQNAKIAEEGCLLQLARATRNTDHEKRAFAHMPETSRIVFSRKNGGISLYRALDLLEEKKLPDLTGKIVVVGATAQVLHDYHKTSIGLISGPEILAASLDTLLCQRAAEAKNGMMNRFFLVLAGFVVAFLFSLRRSFRHEMISLLTYFVAVFLAYHLCAFFLCWIPLACFFICWAVTGITVDMILKFLALIDQQIAHAEAACAGKIQMDLFPAKSIMKAGYSIRGLCLPCEETGGDFFDFFELENGNLIFVLGDVAGHGFSAAMVTIMAKTTIKLLRDIDMLSPEAVVKTLNRVLFDLVRKKKFMTMVIGHIDCSSEQIDMVLAGHLPPLLIRSDGRLEELKNNGFPMGIVKNLPINSMSCRLQPGDALITYTDGIIEALNWKNEQYTYPAWYAFLQQNLPGLSEDSPLESLLVDVFRHKQERGFFDDVSLLLVRKTN